MLSFGVKDYLSMLYKLKGKYLIVIIFRFLGDFQAIFLV